MRNPDHKEKKKEKKKKKKKKKGKKKRDCYTAIKYRMRIINTEFQQEKAEAGGH